MIGRARPAGLRRTTAPWGLSAFYAAYRQDANGRLAHDPAMMVALLLYAYSRGQRSSRVIERACVEDIASRDRC